MTHKPGPKHCPKCGNESGPYPFSCDLHDAALALLEALEAMEAALDGPIVLREHNVGKARVLGRDAIALARGETVTA